MLITRRQALITSVGAGIAATSRIIPAQAAAPIAGVPGPAFYRSKLGSYEITVISDGYGVIPKIDGFVINATPEEVRATLAAQFLPTDRIQVPFNTLVVNTGSKLVLIDTGIGDMGPPTTGTWMKNFRAAGFKPEDVDIVVLSHLHPDHINGLRLKDGTEVFPEAEIKINETELNYWTKDAPAASSTITQGYAKAVDRVLGPKLKHLTMYKWGEEVAPGITSIGAPGHTPGHSMFAIASGGATFMAVSDITNVPYLFAKHPDWSVLYDNDPVLARATRHKMLDMLASEKAGVGFYHASFPSFGSIEREGSGYNLVPGFWKAPV